MILVVVVELLAVVVVTGEDSPTLVSVVITD